METVRKRVRCIAAKAKLGRGYVGDRTWATCIPIAARVRLEEYSL